MVRLLSQVPMDYASALHGAAAGPLRQQALALMERLVHRDAMLMAYSDAFYLAGLAMLACVLAGLVLRRS